MRIAKSWCDQHWATLEQSYKRAPFFKQLEPTTRHCYERAEKHERLTDVNEIFLRGIAELLGLKTRITRDNLYAADGAQTERLANIARTAGADRYLSGPTGRKYIDESFLRGQEFRPSG